MTWKSFRGDEWWYSGPIGKVDGACDGRSFSIGSIPKGMHGYKKEVIHGFLFETFDRLKEFTIRLGWSREIESILVELEREGFVSYDLHKSKYGNTFIINNVDQMLAKEPPIEKVKKSWWRLW